MVLPRQDFIDYKKLTEEEPEDSDDEPVDLADVALGTDNKAGLLDRAKSLKEMEKDEQKLERLANLTKKIQINLVGRNKFYKMNQKFFALALFCKLLESVTFNSLSCLPGLFMVLALVAMYDLRKKYSRVFRVFSFVLLYWLQGMMILKVCVQIFMNIPNINAKYMDPHNSTS
jgi:hypothetical protein